MSRRLNAWLFVVLAVLTAFLAWRFIRPMNIFLVSDAFEKPVDTSTIPDPLQTLSARECGACHVEFYREWRTTIHSQAWTDPYFQSDWEFDGSQQICRNCHTPLDRQQPQVILGFRDKDKWDPILEPNPGFDPALQQEGVTCAACHLREGKIVGVLGDTDAPHPVRILDDPNQVCVRCHVVEGDRWDTFFRFPPCGTVAEIEATGQSTGNTGEVVVKNAADLGCVSCHMPAVERPLVAGGVTRAVRQHLWRGGHHPEMVKQGLKVELTEAAASEPGGRLFQLTLTNVGAAHYLPTGTPDRHLLIELRLLDERGEKIRVETHKLERMVMWRPFIIDLWDTRLQRWQPRSFTIETPSTGKTQAAVLEAIVWYYLVGEKRRTRIGYENREPTAYQVFKQRVMLKRAGENEQT